MLNGIDGDADYIFSPYFSLDLSAIVLDGPEAKPDLGGDLLGG